MYSSFNSQLRKEKRFTSSTVAILFLIVVVATSLACLNIGRRLSPTGVPLAIPECLILQADSTPDNFNIKAYAEIVDTVALKWRVESPAVLESLSASDKSSVLIIPMRTAQSLSPQQVQRVLDLVANGAVLVSEGITPLSEQLGFSSGKTVSLKQLQEVAYPQVEITWEKEEQVTLLQVPDKAVVLTREQTSGDPVVCMLPHGRGNCLLLAAALNPGDGTAYGRFPYLLQELRSAGVEFPFRSDRLSALFDYAYRLKDDPDALASEWRITGIQSLHVSAWYFGNGDQTADEYLRKLIDACHRNGILVYAWLELPHVSSKFWDKHPEWREKTASGRDAHVDWRLVMNLSDPNCFRAVSAELETLFRSFDWDGTNLSEIYFDSPSGKEEPDSFTPLSSTVRADFKQRSGIDPIDFFKKESPNYWGKNAGGWNKFVEYRVELEKELNERFLQLMLEFRRSFSPNLDIVVTYVDNIYDSTMREAVGADVSLMFGLLNRYDYTLVLEDPGTVWHLGPRRYAELAQTYSKMTPHAGRLGIDINIVDRDVQTYPTSKQTGSEFLELFAQAGSHFQTVMVYSEKTMLPQDANLVSYALAAGTRAETDGHGIRTSAAFPILYHSGLPQADFEVDGDAWPCVNNGDVLLPAGFHSISVSNKKQTPQPHLVKLNGNLVRARYAEGSAIEFSYRADHRAVVIFDGVPKTLKIDNGAATPTQTAVGILPRGSHKVRVVF